MDSIRPAPALIIGNDTPKPLNLLQNVKGLGRVLVRSPHRGSVLLLFFAIGAAIVGNAIGQVRLNVWQGHFYDALSSKNIGNFLSQLYLFLEIIAGLIVVGVLQTWSQEMIKMRLREALTRDLFEEWLKPKRAYLLGLMGEIGVNPDQRVQEDARHLTELTADLGIGLLQSSLLLVSFIGVLWLLSSQVVFYVHGSPMVIPGYMVWCALIYAAAGSLLTWAVGHPLIKLNAEHYQREAAFRFSLVRFNESAEGVALYGGEAVERDLLIGTLNTVLDIMKRLANRLANLTWITSSYGFIAIVVPVVVASPGFFAGTLSFGGMMMVVGAFYQVQQALRWFIDNFSRIADWHATIGRVMSFRAALLSVDKLDPGTRRIRVLSSPDGHLRFDHLAMVLGDHEAELEESEVDIEPGEHVQIIGGLGSGKTALFRMMAGLWQSGIGTISLPDSKTMMFMPQRSYLPLGALRTALTYPLTPAGVDDAALLQALERVGLSRLKVGGLDEIRRWDRDMTLSEQQCLAFARLLIHKPEWIVLDGTFDTLDDATRQRVLSIFNDELCGAAVISIGEALLDDPFFGRILHLRRKDDPIEPKKKRAKLTLAAIAGRR